MKRRPPKARPKARAKPKPRACLCMRGELPGHFFRGSPECERPAKYVFTVLTIGGRVADFFTCGDHVFELPADVRSILRYLQ